ncbi:MAG: hypothetical protein ACI9VR_002008 [Cognaticolwellia sp.]|jgi:hypothetical protein
MLLLLLACTRAPVKDEPMDTPLVAPAPVDLCAFGIMEAVGELTDPELTETSGLVQSRLDAGLFWAHNDSGDTPRLFALSESGAAQGIVTLDIEKAVDWEDMAAGTLGGDPVLVIGDIGDNREKRQDILVHWLPEPTQTTGVDLPVSTVTLTYPDGARDSEAIFVDPVSGDLILVAKSQESEIYRLPAPWKDGELEQVGNLVFGDEGLPGGNRVTGADAFGARVILRTYTHLFVFEIPEGGTAIEALAGPACEVSVAAELQGESVALGEDRYWTISEGLMAPVHRAVAE